MKRIAVFTACALAGPALAADPATIDWSQVPARSLTLFYPGQSTYQWLRSPAPRAQPWCRRARRASPATRARRRSSATRSSRADPLEPTPRRGQERRPSSSTCRSPTTTRTPISASSGRTKNSYPGDAYPYYRFDGKEWKAYGAAAAATRRAQGRAAGDLRGPPVDDDRRRLGAGLRQPGLLAHLPQRRARHAGPAERRAGSRRTRSTRRSSATTCASTCPRRAPMPTRPGTRA